ncbi:MAG: tRNA (N6-isopentenyl adenosine(37)-C2)-methylthiotransferase MiaB [Dehalococcoidia bacterium]|nr:tRNA (N6-isopentenyl adenosine(37)-C2)-methylthiotransferase MiaB [Dehalococcoidia bacterium]
MSNYHIWTIGCQMNKAESERLESLFAQKGMQEAARPEEADFVVINTCVVRKHAEDRVTNKLHTLKALKKANPALTLAVTGCWVDSDIDQMKRDYPFIDYFFRAGECPPWQEDEEWRGILPASPDVTAYVPIIQGCNNFCAYCIVPYRRGREKSRPLAEVVCEVREMVKRGVREVTLLGQNVDSYGHDLPEKPDLADLLVELNSIEGLWRIRFLTNHPKDMSRKLIETIVRLEKVCHAINLPVQAGSNEILSKMRRGYTVEEYRSLIARLREKIPGIALSNDVIVGFPGETEAQFQETVDLLSGLRFDVVHIAAYSPRPGTIAAREMKDDVPQAEKKRRLQIIEKVQECIAGEINKALVGTEVEVLVERKEKGNWYGRTSTDKIVFFNSHDEWSGKRAIVKIERASPWSLKGMARQ